jgi:hypothetical protein
MRKLLQPSGDLLRFLELGPARRAFSDVRTKRSQTKAPLAVDEEIDLVGK